jgi:hypothetical protein
MDIFQQEKIVKERLEEAKKMTQKELDEANIKMLKSAFGEKVLCGFCQHNFSAFTRKHLVLGFRNTAEDKKKEAERGIELRQYMHELCGNPCKKGFRYNSEKNIIEKVEK